MRIIAGELGGRIFAAPKGHRTHPMSDRVRGGLFNTLGDLGGLCVLDGFAGSGALSFEAVSRGAVSAVAIESDRLAQQTISENIPALGLAAQVKLIKASAGAWLQTNPGAKFDIVLCDPPYDDVQPQLLLRLAARVRQGGIIVLSLPPRPRQSVALPALTYRLETTKSYGDAELTFYRRTAQ